MTNAAYRDHLGRPIVAVTGMGVITSLGQGLQDNWAALTGGVSGIHDITRFPVDGLNTRISGTVDFIDLPVENPVERSYAYARETTDEALAQAGLSGEFGGPLFLAGCDRGHDDVAAALGRFDERQRRDPGCAENADSYRRCCLAHQRLSIRRH